MLESVYSHGVVSLRSHGCDQNQDECDWEAVFPWLTDMNEAYGEAVTSQGPADEMLPGPSSNGETCISNSELQTLW